MDGFILLGILLLVGIPIISIVALVVAVNARAEARDLRRRLTALEGGALASPSHPARQTSAATPPPLPVSEPPPPPLPPRAPGAVPAAAAPSPTPAQPAATLEQRFGTQWVVWIGGLALALGAVFLVRYAIEQDLVGPGVRIVLGGLLAAALIAAGEWARRKEIAAGLVAMPTQHIPSTLTAAGTVAAYATVYAAYALYGFLPPAAAFIMLGIVALATLTAALLHGPALAGLGIAGAYVAPMLVATEEPSYWALYLYLSVVNAAAFALARTRLWRWLAITSVVIGAAWTLPGVEASHVEALGAHLFHTVAGFTLAAALIVSGLLFGPAYDEGAIDPVSSGAIGAYLCGAAIVTCASYHDPAALLVFAVLTLATVAVCWRTSAALWALPAAGLMAAIVMAQWTRPEIYVQLVMPPGVTAGAVPDLPTGTAPHVVFAAGLALLFGGAGFAAQGRSQNPIVALLWSGCAVVTPILLLIALYLRIAEFDRSIPFAGLALLLAALYGVATDVLSKREVRPGLAGSAAVFATGSVASLALALTFALEKGWLTVGLALMVPGIAWISEQRPLPALRYLAAAVAILVVLRIGYEPRIVGADVGTTPIFNWLLYGYGVPSASFWFAGHRLRRRADDWAASTVEAAAILFTVLLGLLEIRHYVNGGNLYPHRSSLEEIAMQVSVGLAMAIGLERVRLRTRSAVHNIGALIVAAMTLAAIVLGLLLNFNPLIHRTTVGGPFINLILLGYGIPAMLSAILALVARSSRPLAYRHTAAATAVTLALLYLTLEVRRLYHGSTLMPWDATSDLEQYTYSVVWLAFGVALLAAGFLLTSQPARLASAAVVTATIAKAFLIDMAGLTGIFRALSFIGLGVVLMGIGWLYQRLLFPAPRVPPADAAGAS